MPDESKASNATAASEKIGASNLQQMNVSDLRKLIADAEALASKKVEQEKKMLLSKFEREAAELGFSISVEWSDLPAPEPGAKAPKKSRGKAAAKYRGPNGEEWSGRGRPPKWLTLLHAEGRNREEFRI